LHINSAVFLEKNTWVDSGKVDENRIAPFIGPYIFSRNKGIWETEFSLVVEAVGADNVESTVVVPDGGSKESAYSNNSLLVSSRVRHECTCPISYIRPDMYVANVGGNCFASEVLGGHWKS
jgi:hypothetical protein